MYKVRNFLSLDPATGVKEVKNGRQGRPLLLLDPGTGAVLLLQRENKTSTAVNTPPSFNIDDIIAENHRRHEAQQEPYDPLTGQGCCGVRVHVAGKWLPRALLEAVPGYASLPPLEQDRERIKHDFEFWCARCASIQDKVTNRIVPFVPNRPQRRVAAAMEQQRLTRHSVRLIVLKARQWGSSTLAILYMAWMQIVVHRNWNCLICSHQRGSSGNIGRIYSQLLRHYPAEMLDPGVKRLELKTLEGMRGVKELSPRGGIIVTGSASSQDAVRGFNLAMAHLSEVAFWKDSARHDPVDVMRTVEGSVMLGGDTVVILESTANGVGNFFHNEWLRASSGQSDKQPIFVPWHEIEIYQLPVADARQLWGSMDDYERELWNKHGCTLEQINWYHHKRKVYPSHNALMAEFPSNAVEAFDNTGCCAFGLESLDKLRDGCTAPQFKGDITSRGDGKNLQGIGLLDNTTGGLKVWRMPEATATRNRYIAAVDIGGRSDKSDYSVITVVDRKELPDEKMEVVAQWRGHIDHDLLAWKAAQLATFYGHALLVFESNTLETEQNESDDAGYIAGTLARAYGNIYFRAKGRAGFHTNVHTKGLIVHHLIALVRDGQYIEHDQEAVDEMSWFALLPHGRFGAIEGKHDDIVMSRAIALYMASQLKRGRRFDYKEYCRAFDMQASQYRLHFDRS